MSVTGVVGRQTDPESTPRKAGLRAEQINVVTPTAYAVGWKKLSPPRRLNIALLAARRYVKFGSPRAEHAEFEPPCGVHFFQPQASAWGVSPFALTTNGTPPPRIPVLNKFRASP